MYNLNEIPTTDYNDFFQKVYFISIIKNIIKIADLDDTKKTILDFGCGQKILSKTLKNVKVLNYDIKEEFSDLKSYKNLKFDIIVFNHVLMYMRPEEISNLLDELREMNPNSKIIVGLGKQNIVSKIGKFLTGNREAHENTISTYKEQINILLKKTTFLKKKSNIFFMTDIYYTKF